MKKILALLLAMTLLCPIPTGAQDLDTELEDVEEDLIRQEETRQIMEVSAPEEEGRKGGTWLYLLGGLVLIGAAAGGGGGGGGDGSSSDGSMTISW